MRHVHVTVLGQVQGVGFRYHTYMIASQLGVKGWVQNQYDGTVEIDAEGPEAKVIQFLDEVKKGPFHARVDNMMVIELAEKADYNRFDIR